MTGEGARLWGGRWNPPGISAVYLAESRALAALEIIVHAPREVIPLEWCLIEVEVPDDLIESIEMTHLPPDWMAMPSSPGARNFGGDWLGSGSHAALLLPSVVIPEEHALLLNPLHPDAVRVKVSKPLEFRFDHRF